MEDRPTQVTACCMVIHLRSGRHRQELARDVPPREVHYRNHDLHEQERMFRQRLHVTYYVTGTSQNTCTTKNAREKLFQCCKYLQHKREGVLQVPDVDPPPNAVLGERAELHRYEAK